MYIYKMYRPGNLHKIVKNIRSQENVTKAHCLFTKYFMDCFKNQPIAPLHRWCHGSSEQYKTSCNVWKKVENANRDNNF